MPEHYDAIIVGAGAAGLMCAQEAAHRGRRVLVLDHSAKPGRKILISGGGRCNFTHLGATAANYLSANPHFCKGPLARYTPQHFLELVNQAKIRWEDRGEGRLFCRGSARQILDLLLRACSRHGVQLMLECPVQQLEPLGDGSFRLSTPRGCFHAPRVVIATGGLSLPKLGASSWGLDLATRFGHHIQSTRAGLVPFTFSRQEREAWQQLAGLSLPVEARCRQAAFREALLFTHRGLSGPAILQLSSYWTPGEEIVLNLLPQTDLAQALTRGSRVHPARSLRRFMAELLPRRLAEQLLAGPQGELPLERLSAQARDTVIQQVQEMRVRPAGTEGYRTAEVMLGGVDVDELSSRSLESRLVPGLHFIGEVVDVTGQLGGYNFQWAWSSGWCAAQEL